jgi:hypothetical protein
MENIEEYLKRASSRDTKNVFFVCLNGQDPFGWFQARTAAVNTIAQNAHFEKQVRSAETNIKKLKKQMSPFNSLELNAHLLGKVACIFD